MREFFRRTMTLASARNTVTASKRSLSTYTKEFELAHESGQTGKLVKIVLSDQGQNTKAVWNSLQIDLMKSNPNSLFIWTMPTTRSTGQYHEFFYPGHNFTSATNDTGDTVCSMSKRPNTKMILGERKCAPDHRFKTQNNSVRQFQPRFTSVEEEIDVWLNRASSAKDYPLFVHIIPMDYLSDLDLETYKDNVDYLIAKEESYTLRSSVHPFIDDYFLPASNCNSASAESIFGKPLVSVHDLFCQEAAMKIVARFINNPVDYMQHTESMGLTQGIEPTASKEDDYRCSFTC